MRTLLCAKLKRQGRSFRILIVYMQKRSLPLKLAFSLKINKVPKLLQFLKPVVMKFIILFLMLGIYKLSAIHPGCSKCRELVEVGVRYSYHDIRSVDNLHSWSKCKEHCKREPKCRYWTFNQLRQCWLKTSDEGRQRSPHQITSGTNKCESFIVSAAADWKQNNLCGFKVENLEGHLLKNGNFIFFLLKGKRRMVLTDDQGNVLKAG